MSSKRCQSQWYDWAGCRQRVPVWRLRSLWRRVAFLFVRKSAAVHIFISLTVRHKRRGHVVESPLRWRHQSVGHIRRWMIHASLVASDWVTSRLIDRRPLCDRLFLLNSRVHRARNPVRLSVGRSVMIYLSVDRCTLATCLPVSVCFCSPYVVNTRNDRKPEPVLMTPTAAIGS